MKKLLRRFLITLVALWATAIILPPFNIAGGTKTLLTGAAIFMVIDIFVKPFIKIALLPINLLTLGIFSWFVNVLGLYVLTLALPQFKIAEFDFPGAVYAGFTIPAAHLNVLVVAIAASFLIGLITNLLKWLVKD